MADVSVAICTYNRAESLSDTLEFLCRQELTANLDWELLLIDNNCTDNTEGIVEQFVRRLPLHYFLEARQGLSYARNKAINECQGDLLVFTDDDVRPEPRWLTSFVEASAKYAAAEYFGGPIVPWWPGGRPNWVKDINMSLLAGVFGAYDHGDEDHCYSEDEMHPFGANFALRRSLFERMEAFRIDLGARGETPGRGEEAEYFARCRMNSVVGVYVANAKLHHRVELSKLNLGYLYRYGIQKGIARRKTSGLVIDKNYGAEFSYLAKALFQLLKGRRDRFRQCVINAGIQKGLRNSKYSEELSIESDSL